jgi:hypothetical protein
MKLYPLVFQQQNRYKFWNWDEVFAYTKLTPTEAKQLIDNKEYQLNDPLSALVFSHKNHDQRALDNIFDNYNNPSNFLLSYNDYGLSTNFILHTQSPVWQSYNTNTDWYWKQNWIYKHGQLLTIFPGVQNVFLSCSSALENSHDGSDIDLMIQVRKNFVWITKPYFASLSKVLKYYDLNSSLAAFYFITNQISKLEKLKRDNVKYKIKIDFGLVFEDQKDLEKYYSNKERNLFIWSALEIKSLNIQNRRVEVYETQSTSTDLKPNVHPVSFTTTSSLNASQANLVETVFQEGNSIQTKKLFNKFVFKIIKTILYPTLILIAPFGILNYCYEQKHRDNYNKLVLWNIYSQYNLVY